MNEQFVAGVEGSLARAGVLHAGATWLVALSGGADSVALLHALCTLRARHGAQLCAAHVEHGLRGDCDFDSVSQVASAMTPVPGGVGPMTIALLLRNTLQAYRAHIGAE